MNKKVIFAASFVVLAFLIMFVDAQYHIGFVLKPSAAFTHAAHSSSGESHEGHEVSAGMSSLDNLPLEKPPEVLHPEVIYENGKKINVFNLTLEVVKKEIRPGVYIEAWGFNGRVPGPELRVKEGELVRVYFTNLHNNPDIFHTIHWHGVHVAPEMDGVPHISQKPVKVNETFIYEFIAGPSGTHIYHCHVDTDHHIDMGMYGAFIVEAKDEDLKKYDQEITWVLSSVSTASHHHHANQDSDYFSGHNQYKADKDAFLINGKAFPATQSINVKKGDLIKLRMINIGKEPYSMHIHGHSFTVTHKDGFKIKDLQEMDTLPILPGERYDIEIKMNNSGIWPFHDHFTQHVTNNGFYPGGMLSLILYEDYSLPQHFKDFLEKINDYNEKARNLGTLPELTMSNMYDMGSMEESAGEHNHG